MSTLLLETPAYPYSDHSEERLQNHGLNLWMTVWSQDQPHLPILLQLFSLWIWGYGNYKGTSWWRGCENLSICLSQDEGEDNAFSVYYHPHPVDRLSLIMMKTVHMLCDRRDLQKVLRVESTVSLVWDTVRLQTRDSVWSKHPPCKCCCSLSLALCTFPKLLLHFDTKIPVLIGQK